MTYPISQKNDLNRGAQLVISFPEAELDKKALYTLQEEFPSFLVPFRHRCVDGRMECTYQLGNRTKLRYRFGQREPREYVRFWEQILQPLSDCADWFLTPLSFVTDVEHLYVDKEDAVSYLYVPAVQPWGGREALLQMVTELSRCNPVTDPKLENQVLRSIMEGFQPQNFLNILRAYRTATEPEPPAPQPRADVYPPAAPEPVDPVVQAAPAPEHRPQPAQHADDIVIRLGGPKEKKREEKPAKGWSLFKGKKQQEAAQKGGSRKKEKRGQERQIHLGAEVPEVLQTPPMAAEKRWEVREDLESEVTQLQEEQLGPYLRLVGNAALPREIPVTVRSGQPFTIGRFDVTVGHRQSDFEFDKHTRAVSRRHAAIESGPEGYVISDLASSAGTFVNGERLTPNVPRLLRRGDRVSFGNGGADYVWEA